MKYLKLLCLFSLFGFLISCSDDTTEIEQFTEETELETRRSCEGCTVSLSQNGCAINATVGEGCPEIGKVEWGYPPPSWAPPGTGPTWHPGSINGITASSSGGTYCIRVQFAGCPQPVETCITIPPGCDELCEGCTVDFTASENNCMLTAVVGSGCTQPVEFEWYVDGVTSTGPTAPYADGGTYCLTVIDANGCKSRACKHVDRCDPCSDETCEIEIVPDVSDCKLSVQFSGFCGDGVTYQWYIDGNYTDDYNPSYVNGGTYCVTITQPNGCETSTCLAGIDYCECTPEWETSSINPYLSFHCNPNNDRILLRSYVNYRYNCNDCCKEVDDSQKELTVNVIQTTTNITKGIVISEDDKNYNRSDCSFRAGRFSELLDCSEISVRDELEFSWRVEIIGYTGCEFVGNTVEEGVINHTVTAANLGDCCQ